ncbi:hypothetical protein GCM10011507_04890 [Edaphobacter acidisoli]|uniref:Aldolase n=1 Tax=Edaphobacter acidisoli TaxID=2040573 RepID=A0A916W050_9BACT|nr:aldolase [Edaphobacter acidisoli]GGA56586.1 hypothetical protein GCM10011507_04890 [Edaphobacter acidisoli]
MIELEQERSIVAAELAEQDVDMPNDDPLQCKVPLNLKATFYPLGFSVEIATNSQEVLDAAAESWGGMRHRYMRPTLRLYVGVRDSGLVACPPAPVVRAQRHLLSIIADSHNHALCDLREGFAYMWVNRGSIRHRNYLRYHFLEAPTLVLISTLYVVPIHAACVSRYGCGMLLCGPSGMGKSTLAYACARAGWTYTTDDGSQLLLDAGRAYFVGNSRQFRFRPSAKTLFPELHGRSLTPRAQGKPSIEVPVSELPSIVAADEAAAHCAIFLNRQPTSTAELRPFSKDIAMDYFRESVDVFPPEAISQLQRDALEYLSTIQCYELRYSDLPQALDQLDLLARNCAQSLT